MPCPWQLQELVVIPGNCIRPIGSGGKAVPLLCQSRIRPSFINLSYFPFQDVRNLFEKKNWIFNSIIGNKTGAILHAHLHISNVILVCWKKFEMLIKQRTNSRQYLYTLKGNTAPVTNDLPQCYLSIGWILCRFKLAFCLVIFLVGFDLLRIHVHTVFPEYCILLLSGVNFC